MQSAAADSLPNVPLLSDLPLILRSAALFAARLEG
jgi:hypothetical protein